jgi:tetratricopeptide (TPR) repeat protein
MDADEVVDLLSNLVDKSLVVADEASGRYRLLDMVRGFSAERLAESGEADAATQRHFLWTSALAREAQAQLDGPNTVLWLERLETEHDNIRAALTHPANPQERLQLAVDVHRFWFIRGYLTEGIGWLDAALHSPHESRSDLRSKALNCQGILTWRKGDYGAARIAYEMSLKLAMAEQDSSRMAATLNNLGLIADAERDYTAALLYFSQARSIYTELGDRPKTGMVLANLGAAQIALGLLDEADGVSREFLSISEELENPWNIATAWHNLAEIALRRGQPDETLVLLRKAAPLMLSVGDGTLILQMFRMSSQAAVAKGDAERAVKLMIFSDKYQDEGGLHCRRVDLDDHARAMECAKSLLSPAAFANCCQQGRALTEETAVALVLDCESSEFDNLRSE